MGPKNKIPEKSKNFKTAIKRLFKSLNKWKYVMILCLVLASVSAVLSLIAPNKLSDMTNKITIGLQPKITKNTFDDIIKDENIPEYDKQKLLLMMKDIDKKSEKQLLNMIDELPDSIYNVIKPSIDIKSVKNIALLLTILYILSAILNYSQSLIMTSTSNNYAKKLRRDLSKKINKLPLKYFDKHETGDILSRVTNDIDTIAQTLNQSASQLVTSITLFIGSIIMMFITNWIMAISAIISSIIGFAFMSILLSKSQKYFQQRQEELGKLNGYIEEIYTGHNVVKSYNAEKKVSKKFNDLNRTLYNCNRKSQFISGLMPPLMGFVGNLGYVAVCVVGALLVANNTISFGVIIAFMVYVRLFVNPLSQIAQAMTNLQSTAAASERVFDFIDEQEMTNETNLKTKLEKNTVRGQIEFKNVKFGYDETRTIIKDFTASVKPGEKVAIVGPTGAGKTTMVNLLMKFYEINSGDILIDNVSIKELSRENIHDLFVMVLQDTWLFDGTIKENLKFNNEKISDKQIKEVCECVGIEHFINTLPGGFDSPISNNDSISSGQKQLLTIARGMIERAPFLILDEATSNVDTRTEELVSLAMDKLTEGKTSFIIAHRLSTIKNADLILVMNEGNIIEQGSHNSLMKQNGFYADLYNSQFKKNI